MEILSGLNPAQAEAVQTTHGPLLILAGPGSGKTRVIAHRIAYLVREERVAPWRILAVTFTNKAAKEMRERVEKLLGEASTRGMALGTFHARCARILREDGAAEGIDPHFTIYDTDEQLTLMKRVVLDISVDPKKYSPRAILGVISRAKNELVSPAEYRRRVEDYFQEVVARAYARYQELLDESKALDFDDLLLRTVNLFEQHERVLAKYQDKYQHLMIDEFQDTNIVQYTLARQLAHPERGGQGNICVVGDVDQSIYSWRSADYRNILNFEHDFPGATIVLLEQNYRSTQTILDTAQGVIARNTQRHDKNLWTENGQGVPVTVYEAEDAEDEARFIRDEITAAIRSGARRPRDFAVMYRTNAQSRAVEEAMTTSGVPYQVVGQTHLWERREVRDLLSYLFAITRADDWTELERIANIPSRGISTGIWRRTIEWAKACHLSAHDALRAIAAAQTGAPVVREIGHRSLGPLQRFTAILLDLIEKAPRLTPRSLLREVIDCTGYRSYLCDGSKSGDGRWQNVSRLLEFASRYEDLPTDEAMDLFLDDCVLIQEDDSYDEHADTVTLISLHVVKGLEFPVVFIAGMEEALLPHIRSYDEPEQMEEERRLCYVGLASTKEKLYLSHARYRVGFGGGAHNPPSRFLKDVPARLVEGRTGEDRRVHRPNSHQRGAASPWTMPARTPVSAVPARAAATAATTQYSFEPGDRVRHTKFGDGIVVGARPSGDDLLVEVAFKGTVGVKKLMASFAGLEKM